MKNRRKKKKRKKRREGYYGLFTLLSTFHGQENLFFFVKRLGRVATATVLTNASSA
jgi:hypothetical protein